MKHFIPSLRRLAPLALLAAIGLGGCATVPADGQTQAKADPPPVASAQGIYARLDQAVQAYQDALVEQQQQQSGAGQAILAALDQVNAAARDCARTPRCDMQRVSAAYDRLLRLREHVGSDSQALVGTDADGMAGESSPVLTIVPQTQRAVALLKNGGLSDLVANNDAVKAAIEEWLTQMRSQLMQSYVNYQFLRTEMAPAYHKAGLPEALLFGIMAKESAGKVHAVSRAGAAGPLQFMPGTAAEYGLRVVNGFDQRFDPRLEALANAEFINQQLKAFNDNLELTLAAYNAGPGFIGRLAAGSNDPNFWSPRIYDQLAPETREYVPMVLAAAWLFLHPQRYNLVWPNIDGDLAQVKLLTPASLSELTICLGQAGGMQDGWFRTLRNLNPQLDAQSVQPVGSTIRIPQQLQMAYAAQCAPDSRWMQLAQTLHAATPPPLFNPPPPRQAIASARHYRVQPGDTLNGIAQRFGCSDPLVIARANGLQAPGYMIRPGMVLRVAGCDAGASGPVLAQGGSRVYRVEPGDTLNAIAQRFGCSDPVAIARANGLQAPNYAIFPGMKLRVACAATQAATAPALAQTTTYRVRPGDTLNGIAQRFGCSDPLAIARANGLRAPSYAIFPGMQLHVACGTAPAAQAEVSAIRSYRVQAGDTLNAIAERVGCRNPLALARANGLQPPAYAIFPGMKLRVPMACAAGSTISAAQPAGAGAVADVRNYTVQPGDTLSAIAQRFGCQDPASIAAANGLSAPYMITAGMELRLPACGRG